MHLLLSFLTAFLCCTEYKYVTKKMCVVTCRMWTSRRSASWSGRLVLRPVSERGSGRCRRPDRNRPKRSTENGSSTKGRRPFRISKLSCLTWWATCRFLFSHDGFVFAVIICDPVHWEMSVLSGALFRCSVVRHPPQPAKGPSLGICIATGKRGEREAV